MTARASKSCETCANEYPIYNGHSEFHGLGCLLDLCEHGTACELYHRGESKYKHATRRWLVESGESGTEWLTPEKPIVGIGEHIRKESDNGFRAPKKSKRTRLPHSR